MKGCARGFDENGDFLRFLKFLKRFVKGWREKGRRFSSGDWGFVGREVA